MYNLLGQENYKLAMVTEYSGAASVASSASQQLILPTRHSQFRAAPHCVCCLS